MRSGRGARAILLWLTLSGALACGNVRSSPPDAAPPPPPDAAISVTPPSALAPSGGGGVTQSPRHRARVVVGAPEPSGAGQAPETKGRISAPIGR